MSPGFAMSNPPPTAPQLRHAIDSGRTRGKTSALDPAAAPLEADAEAGGAAPSAAEIAQSLHNEADDARGDATPAAPNDSMPLTRSTGDALPWVFAAFGVGVILLIFVGY